MHLYVYYSLLPVRTTLPSHHNLSRRIIKMSREILRYQALHDRDQVQETSWKIPAHCIESVRVLRIHLIAGDFSNQCLRGVCEIEVSSHCLGKDSSVKCLQERGKAQVLRWVLIDAIVLVAFAWIVLAWVAINATVSKQQQSSKTSRFSVKLDSSTFPRGRAGLINLHSAWIQHRGGRLKSCRSVIGKTQLCEMRQSRRSAESYWLYHRETA